jgi:hypothetical protein
MAIGDTKLKGPVCIFRWLLLLYPPGFRQRFGQEMLQVFQNTCAQLAPDGGFASRLLFWLRTLNDLARSVPGEWRQALQRHDKIGFPVGQWADSLVVPLIVAGSILVAGDLGATLVQSRVMASGKVSNFALMVTACVAVGVGLGILGILGALVAARNPDADGRWIKLSA